MKLLIGGWIVFVIVLVYGLCQAAKQGNNHERDDYEFIELQNRLACMAMERNNHGK